MPKITKTLENIELPTEQELEIIDEYINSKPEIKQRVDSIKTIFDKHFCFGTEEIKVFIYNICKDLEDNTIKEFESLYTAFADNDISSFDNAERRAIARGIINDTIALYKVENRKISDEFIAILEEARFRKIDPFKLAIKTNMKGANLEKFQDSLQALTNKKYFDSRTKTESNLLDDEELKALLEQCPSVAYKASEESVAQLLSLLNDLFWDEEKNAYLYDVRSIIKSVPSLLTINTKQIQQTIEMLELFYSENGKAALLTRIKKSPSLLTINFEKISKFSKVYTKAIDKLISHNPKTSKLYSNTLHYAQEVSDNFIMNIDNLTQIEKFKLEHIDEISDILMKYLGEENAVTCLQNMTVLSTNPAFLEYMLASIVQEEGLTGSTELREYFVKNPYSALTKIEVNNEQLVKKNKSNDEEDFVIKKAEKQKIEIKDFPKIFISDSELASIKKRAGNRNSGLTQALLDKMKKTAEEAERRQREEAKRIAREREEQEALRRQERREEKRKKKEAKKIIKQNNKQIGIAVNVTSTVIPKELSLPKQELSLEEKQALRRSKVKPLPAFPKNYYTDKDMFRILYEPIIDAFVDNGFYPKKLPKFSLINKGFEALQTALTQSYATYIQLEKHIDILKALTYDEKNDTTSSDILKTLSTKFGTNNEIFLDSITKVGRELYNQVLKNDEKYTSAINAINKSTEKNSDAEKLLEKIDSKSNLFKKYDSLKINIGSYVNALELQAKDFFGDEYVEMFFPQEREELRSHFEKFFNSGLNPKCYNTLILEEYVNRYYNEIFQEFQNKEIIIYNDKVKIVENFPITNNTPRYEVKAKRAEEFGISVESILSFISLLNDANKYTFNKTPDILMRMSPKNKEIVQFVYDIVDLDNGESEIFYVFSTPNHPESFVGTPAGYYLKKFNANNRLSYNGDFDEDFNISGEGENLIKR